MSRIGKPIEKKQVVETGAGGGGGGGDEGQLAGEGEVREGRGGRGLWSNYLMGTGFILE